MEEKVIKVLSDFSISPGPRYCKQGPDSGEEFYHRLLNKDFKEAYQQNKLLVIDLDGTDGYMSSFLDEAIGNLVYDFGKLVVEKHLKIISNEEPVWNKLIEERVIDAWERRRENVVGPLKTYKRDHNAWYRLTTNGKLEKGVWIHSA